MVSVDLSSTGISGSLDARLSNWTRVKLVDLSSTHLEGSASTDVALNNWSGLHFLYMSNTHLSGTLSPSCVNNRDLTVVDFSRTHLSGTVPDCVWNLNLAVLDLSDCNLSGIARSTDVLRNSTAMSVLLARNRIPFNKSMCPREVQIDTLDLSGKSPPVRVCVHVLSLSR